ncbi:hypothetical protein TNCV_4680131 [Trichonephila clavipes]|nr:hypothetical protein TNCV_4680131 [Trichonephila clavipes]
MDESRSSLGLLGDNLGHVSPNFRFLDDVHKIHQAFDIRTCNLMFFLLKEMKKIRFMIPVLCNVDACLIYVALYHIHYIWHSRERSRESGQPNGRLHKSCQNAVPPTITVSLG